MVSIVSVSPVGWSEVQIVVGTNIFFFSKSTRQALGSPSLYFRGTQVLSRDSSSRDVKLTTHVHLELRLTWSCTSMPLLCLHDMGIRTNTPTSQPNNTPTKQSPEQSTSPQKNPPHPTTNQPTNPRTVFFRSVCPSTLMNQLGSVWKDFHQILHWRFCTKICRYTLIWLKLNQKIFT